MILQCALCCRNFVIATSSWHFRHFTVTVGTLSWTLKKAVNISPFTSKTQPPLPPPPVKLEKMCWQAPHRKVSLKCEDNTQINLVPRSNSVLHWKVRSSLSLGRGRSGYEITPRCISFSLYFQLLAHICNQQCRLSYPKYDFHRNRYRLL